MFVFIQIIFVSNSPLISLALKIKIKCFHGLMAWPQHNSVFPACPIFHYQGPCLSLPISFLFPEGTELTFEVIAALPQLTPNSLIALTSPSFTTFTPLTTLWIYFAHYSNIFPKNVNRVFVGSLLFLASGMVLASSNGEYD